MCEVQNVIPGTTGTPPKKLQSMWLLIIKLGVGPEYFQMRPSKKLLTKINFELKILYTTLKQIFQNGWEQYYTNKMTTFKKDKCMVGDGSYYLIISVLVTFHNC